MNRLREALVGSLPASALLLTVACAVLTPSAQPSPIPSATRLGSIERPLVIALPPTLDPQKARLGESVSAALSRATGLAFRTMVPATYAGAIEGLCSETVDVAFLTSLGYVLAKEKGCAALLSTRVLEGRPALRGQIRVHVDSAITDLAELRGRTFAFGEPISAAGSIYPQVLIRQRFNLTAREFFRQYLYVPTDDGAMILLYTGQVDGAASAIDPRTEVPSSAAQRYPDMAQRTKRIAETDDVPGDPLVVRRALPADIADRVKQALLEYARTEAGRKILLDVFSTDGFVDIPDARYDAVREGARLAGVDLEREAAATPRPPAGSPTPRPSATP